MTKCFYFNDGYSGGYCYAHFKKGVDGMTCQKGCAMAKKRACVDCQKHIDGSCKKKRVCADFQRKFGWADKWRL